MCKSFVFGKDFVDKFHPFKHLSHEEPPRVIVEHLGDLLCMQPPGVNLRHLIWPIFKMVHRSTDNMEGSSHWSYAVVTDAQGLIIGVTQ